MKTWTLKNVSTYRYEKLTSEFDIVNMRGRELQVSSFHRPPFTYINKTIKQVINGTVEDVFPLDDGKAEYLNGNLIPIKPHN